jgi:hypothetical protein
MKSTSILHLTIHIAVGMGMMISFGLVTFGKPETRGIHKLDTRYPVNHNLRKAYCHLAGGNDVVSIARTYTNGRKPFRRLRIDG